jgi:hypothetical protein
VTRTGRPSRAYGRLEGMEASTVKMTTAREISAAS